ncbi:MAG: hypothetical protein QNJ75_05920 [Acidimicrobiia bacterium]|nr:hypothetical protein [Acidimicrobiia bacterium]
MLRRYAILCSVLALAAACGGEAAPDSSAPTTQADAGQMTTTTAAGTTTTAAVTTDAPPPSTTTSTTTTSTTAAPIAGSTLADGRPATFLAITADYSAVEVDTLTGEIVHVFGQTGTAAEVAAAEEMPPNVLVGIWRLGDGSVVGIADCCEPAAGNIFYVAAGEELVDPYYSDWKEHGWTLSPSPTQNLFANLGYSMVVADPTVAADTGPGEWIDDPSLGFPMGAAAWDRDGSQLWWTTKIKEVAALATLDLAEGAPSHVTVLPWVMVNQDIDGIGSQASGNLVGFVHTRNSDYQVTGTTGVVFSDVGEVLANFPVETGSTWGGYDPAGKFLIYVDGNGTARWQGGGNSGALGNGFIFASW